MIIGDSLGAPLFLKTIIRELLLIAQLENYG